MNIKPMSRAEAVAAALDGDIVKVYSESVLDAPIVGMTNHAILGLKDGGIDDE